MYTEVKGIHHLVTEIEKLRQAVEPITRKRLSVEVFDGPQENASRLEKYAKQRQAHDALAARVLPRTGGEQEDPAIAEPDVEVS